MIERALQLGSSILHSLFQCLVGYLQVLVDIGDDAVTLPQTPPGVRQQDQQQRRVSEKISAIALFLDERALKLLIEGVGDLVNLFSCRNGSDVPQQRVLDRPLVQHGTRMIHQSS